VPLPVVVPVACGAPATLAPAAGDARAQHDDPAHARAPTTNPTHPNRKNVLVDLDEHARDATPWLVRRQRGELRDRRGHFPATTQLSTCGILGCVAVPSAIDHPLADPLIELIAGRFRVLAEPMRIKILDQLRGGDATVTELQEALGASQQNVSKHLGILHGAAMVARTKDGNHVRYSIADEGVFELCEQVCGGVRRQLNQLDAVLPPAR
jgi:DNA-binding transcriptional ArsR family regulator